MDLVASYNSKQRLAWVDVSKFIAAFLVLWGHCIQHLTDRDFSSNPVFIAIYSFHMPLFMILSGFFSSKLIKCSFKKVFVSRFLQLLLPSFVFGIIYWLLARFVFHQTEKEFLQAIYYYFWFLKSLFACILLFYIGSKLNRNGWLGILIMIVFSQFLDFIPHLRFLQLRYMFPCFVLGSVLHHFRTRFYENINVITFISILCFIVMLDGFSKDLLFPAVDIDNIRQMTIGNILYTIYYKLIIGWVGSIGLIGTILIICMKLRDNKIICLLADYGRYTLSIYILQCFLLEMLLREFVKCPNSPIFNILYAPILSAIILFICLVFCVYIDKFKMSWLFDYNRFPREL